VRKAFHHLFGERADVDEDELTSVGYCRPIRCAELRGELLPLSGRESEQTIWPAAASAGLPLGGGLDGVDDSSGDKLVGDLSHIRWVLPRRGGELGSAKRLGMRGEQGPSEFDASLPIPRIRRGPLRIGHFGQAP
jgi:hypothetical protein